MGIDANDRLAIHELMGVYGHIIDAREWHRTAEMFTDDAVYDMTDFDMGVVHGPDGIVELWTGPLAAHPLAHHATNVVVDEDDDGTVRVLSKGIGVLANGRTGSVTYYDTVVNTPDGWKMSARRGVLRRP